MRNASVLQARSFPLSYPTVPHILKCDTYDVSPKCYDVGASYNADADARRAPLNICNTAINHKHADADSIASNERRRFPFCEQSARSTGALQLRGAHKFSLCSRGPPYRADIPPIYPKFFARVSMATRKRNARAKDFAFYCRASANSCEYLARANATMRALPRALPSRKNVNPPRCSTTPRIASCISARAHSGDCAPHTDANTCEHSAANRDAAVRAQTRRSHNTESTPTRQVCARAPGKTCAPATRGNQKRNARTRARRHMPRNPISRHARRSFPGRAARC